MRIGVDARPLQGETQYRGIGKALEHLLLAISKHELQDSSFVFYLDKGLPKPSALEYFPKAKHIYLPTSRLGRVRYVRTFVPKYYPIRPSKRDVDVLLQYDASLGVPASVPCVAVFHDLIPLLFKSQDEKLKPDQPARHFKNVLARTVNWQKYMHSLKNYRKAKHVISISNASKKDLLRYISGIKEKNVSIIFHGAEQAVNEGALGSRISSLGDDKYLLYVGGIDFRKNVTGLLANFYELKKIYPDLKLVTVGREFALEKDLERFGWFKILNNNSNYAKDVISTGFINSAELNYLYTHAAAFVFPSRYEGFGLPILEAMQAGCPVIAYDNSSIPEVAGDAALLVKDGESMVPAIEQVLSDDKLRNDLIAKGKQQAKKFTWEKTARETLEVLESVAKDDK